MKILIVEPFFGGSHAAWAKGFQRHSSHDIEILGLPGKNWKWRMQGAAITLAYRYQALIDKGSSYDLILASDMLDLVTFLGLISRFPQKPALGRNPAVAIYFHENQLTYPPSPNKKNRLADRNRHFGMINFTSALVADKCFFNSDFHRQSFLKALPQLLQRFPDYQELERVDEIEKKSEILHLGLDLEQFLQFKPSETNLNTEPKPAPLILWNHRWEYDKNPEEFFNLLQELIAENLDFEVVILGEHFNPPPDLFIENREILGDRLKYFGFAKNFSDYAAWLWRADILPVTSYHDFFGISVIEAVFCNCYPILPTRLAYPEHFPGKDGADFFYSNHNELLQKIKFKIKSITTTRQKCPGSLVAPRVERYGWKQLISEYDDKMSSLWSLMD